MKTVSDHGWQVVGTSRQNLTDGLLRYDSDENGEFNRLLDRTEPDAVVYSSAWTWVDGCESNPDKADLHNAQHPAESAKVANQNGVRFVFLSTSYVYDGKKRVYTEADVPNPLNVYGKSKLRGEELVAQNTGGKALIIRTMGVYGIESKRKNFLYSVYDKVGRGEKIQVPMDQFGNFTFAGDLAQGIMKLLSESQEGIWNIAGPDPTACRFDLAQEICRVFALNEDLVQPISSENLGQSALRPTFAGLSNEKMVRMFDYKPRTLPEFQAELDSAL